MAAERAVELVPRSDAEFVERFVEVVLNRLGADEKVTANFLVRASLARQTRNLLLLAGERRGGVNTTPLGPARQ